MSTPRVEAYAQALLQVVQVEGLVPEVEDELFRFVRAVEDNDELRTALADPGLPVEQRTKVVEEILSDPALRLTRAIASFVVGAGRGHDLPAIVRRFVELAAAAREHAVAEVRSAVPLDDEQTRRLAEALGRATGKRVHVKVVVDQTVLGGVVARIGDLVIDGTVRHRLDQLKEQI